MIKELIGSALIIESLEAASKEAAIDEILGCLVIAGRLGKRQVASVRRSVMEREARGSTGIGNGVAVPHVKSKGIERLSLALARSAAGISFQAVDGRDVHTIFMILAPDSAAEQHLRVLRWISTLARSQDFRRFVQGSSSEQEIRELLFEMSPGQ